MSVILSYSFLDDSLHLHFCYQNRTVCMWSYINFVIPLISVILSFIVSCPTSSHYVSSVTGGAQNTILWSLWVSLNSTLFSVYNWWQLTGNCTMMMLKIKLSIYLCPAPINITCKRLSVSHSIKLAGHILLFLFFSCFSMSANCLY